MSAEGGAVTVPLPLVHSPSSTFRSADCMENSPFKRPNLPAQNGAKSLVFARCTVAQEVLHLRLRAAYWIFHSQTAPQSAQTAPEPL